MTQTIFNQGTRSERIDGATDWASPEDDANFRSAFDAAANGDRVKVMKKGQERRKDGSRPAPALELSLSSDGKAVLIHDYTRGNGPGTGAKVYLDDPKPSSTGKVLAFPNLDTDSRKAKVEDARRKEATDQEAIIAAWNDARDTTEADLDGNYLTRTKGFSWGILARLGLKAVQTNHARGKAWNPAAAIRDCETGRVIGYEKYMPAAFNGPNKLLPRGLKIGGRPSWIPIGWDVVDGSRRLILCEGFATATAVSVLWPGEQVAACRSIGDVVRVAEWADGKFPSVVVMTEGRQVASPVERALRILATNHPAITFKLPIGASKTPDEVKDGWDGWDYWDSLGRPLSSAGNTLDALPDGLILDVESRKAVHAAEVLKPWAILDKDGNFKGYRGDDVACIQTILEDALLFKAWGRDTSPNGLVILDGDNWQEVTKEDMEADLLATCDALGVMRKGVRESIKSALNRSIRSLATRPPVYDRPTDLLRRAGLDVEWDGADRWDEAAQNMGLDVSTPEMATYARQWVACLFSALFARGHLWDPFGMDCQGMQAEMDVLKRAWVKGDGLATYSVKEDVVFILHGRQGHRKSTLCAAIAAGLRRDFAFLPRDEAEMKRRIYATGGTFGFIQEWGELRGYGDSQNNQSKEFISRSTDDLRTLYVNDPVDYARRHVFLGTTNDADFLRDPTGHRRFAVIDAPRMANIQWIQKNAPQLWAQARHHVLGVLGGGVRDLDDMETLPGNKKPDSFQHWEEIQSVMDSIPNEGLGRMLDLLLAMGNCLGVNVLYQADDPIGERLENAMATRIRKAMDADEVNPKPGNPISRQEAVFKELTTDGLTIGDLMKAAGLNDTSPRETKAMTEALERGGWTQRRKAGKRRWLIHPDKATEVWDRLETMAKELPQTELAPAYYF